MYELEVLGVCVGKKREGSERLAVLLRRGLPYHVKSFACHWRPLNADKHQGPRNYSDHLFSLIPLVSIASLKRFHNHASHSHQAGFLNTRANYDCGVLGVERRAGGRYTPPPQLGRGLFPELGVLFAEVGVPCGDAVADAGVDISASTCTCT